MPRMVWHITQRAFRKTSLAMLRDCDLCGWRRLALLVEPGMEFLGGLGDDIERHVGVLCAAELGALAAPRARLVHLQSDRCLIAGHQVALALEIGRPEAVNHIARGAVNTKRYADRNVNFVSRGQRSYRAASDWGSGLPTTTGAR